MNTLRTATLIAVLLSLAAGTQRLALAQSAGAPAHAPSPDVRRLLTIAKTDDLLPQEEVNRAVSGASKPAPATASAAPVSPGAKVYEANCAICHGERREGVSPGFPPLQGVRRRETDAQITTIIQHGRGRMPGFHKLHGEDLNMLLAFLHTDDLGASPASPGNASPDSPLVTSGRAVFQQNCAFCHGRDAGGGETGPDLTRSRLVGTDITGEKIADVVRNGRTEKNMPRFILADEEMKGVVAFIHNQTQKAASLGGRRKGVDVSDLQTGNAVAGKAYFEGAGGCSSCHSPTGDLKGIATRFEGLQLEERMLYPRDAKSSVTVTSPDGKVFSGKLAYRDEFTIALTDDAGAYHSWPVARVHYKVDDRLDAHVALFPKYTDDDIHNLMAYIQTLR